MWDCAGECGDVGIGRGEFGGVRTGDDSLPE